MDTQLLILSDGKPGHLNQSIALARHLGCDYRVIEVGFRGRWAKALSYAADHCHLLSEHLLLMPEIAERFSAVVSAGSQTYYTNRLLAQRMGVKSIAIMLPRGYRYDFDLIIAQEHDRPPHRDNILTVPINLTWVEPQGLVSPSQGRRYIALIIGGDSTHQRMDTTLLKRQIDQVLSRFSGYSVWLTTSRRTPTAVEKMLQQYSVERAFFYSREPVNPIADFLQHSEYVFLTADSSSMLSEAVSYGSACVEVLPLKGGFPESSKFAFLMKTLVNLNAVHVFDGTYAACNEKISLDAYFRSDKVQRLIL